MERPSSLPLSVNLMPNSPILDVVDLGVLAEQLGYRRCWVYDEGLYTRDVYVTLAALALATKEILIGPGITNPYVRHPGVTAAAVATLDELSESRAFVGIGAGGGLTLDPLGIQRQNPVMALSEMVKASRGLFRGETVDLDGTAFSFRSASLEFGRSDIEIFLAGRGPLVTKLGGQVADGFYLSYIHKSLLKKHINNLRTVTKKQPFTVIYSTMVVTSESEMAEARAALSFRLVDSPPEVKDLIGMTDADTELIRDSLRSGGPVAAAAYVPEAWVDQFAIVGSEKEAGIELRKTLIDNGISEFQLPLSKVKGARSLLERTAAMFEGDWEDF